MNKYKKIIVAAAVCILLVTAIYFISAQASEPPQEPTVHRYIFKDYGGRVACYEEGAEEPFLVTEVIVKDLTPLDRKMLSEGVEVTGAKAMSRALEDYTV